MAKLQDKRSLSYFSRRGAAETLEVEALGIGKQEMEPVTEKEKMMSMSSSLKPTKGGLRTIPFIIVNECFEKVASFGILPNMIFYLKEVYHMQTVSATSILLAWSAISELMAIFGAFLSDSYLGRYRVILIGSISSLLGTILLWSTAMIPQLQPRSCESLVQICKSGTNAQLTALFFSFGLISIGAGCVRPCSIAFEADQLAIKENPNNERILDSYFSWYYASSGISVTIAFTIVVYIHDNLGWKVGFGVPAMLMLLSALMFLSGSPYYIKLNPSKSLLTGFAQVLVVALKNRKLNLDQCSVDQYYHDHDEELLVPTDSLRCLNKARIIVDRERDINPDGSASNSWSLCTVEQVESLKASLRVIPMCSTGILMLLCINQSTFTTLQAQTMDRAIFGHSQIPAGSFASIMIITLKIWVALYDRILVPLLSKFTGCPRGLSCKVRMGIGLLLVCAARAMSAMIETFRRSVAIEQGLENYPDGIVNMSALWIVPESALVGIAQAFNAIGQIEFFYFYFPKSMSSFAMALYTLEIAASEMVGSLLVNIVDKVTSKKGKESWLSSNINRGHLNYYYGLLTFLGLINYLYFLAICWASEHTEEGKPGTSEITEDEQIDYRELPSS